MQRAWDAKAVIHHLPVSSESRFPDRLPFNYIGKLVIRVGLWRLRRTVSV
jgi:hypothetical protein